MIFEEKTLSTEMIYEGRILNLRKDRVTVSGEDESFREIVEHNGGAVILPIKDNGNIVMVRQYRKPFDSPFLELPAGKIDPGETSVEAAKRELAEETGYRAGKIEALGRMIPSVGYNTEVLYLYIATDLKEGEPSPDEHEELDIVEMKLEDAIKMVISGEIEDGKTQIGLLLGEKKLECIISKSL